MKNKKPVFWLIALALLLCAAASIFLLTNPKTVSVDNTPTTETSPSAEASTPSASDTQVPIGLQTHWSVPIEDYTVSLQDGAAENTLEVHVQKNELDWNVLTLDTSYNYRSPEDITIDSFEDILGHNGFRIYRYLTLGEHAYYYEVFYFAWEDTPIQLAYCWGDEEYLRNNVVSIDLDGDNCKELICNVQYVADGYCQTLIYHWNGRSVEDYYGSDMIHAYNPSLQVIMINSTGSQYLPETNKIRTWYYDPEKEDFITNEYDIDLDYLKQWYYEQSILPVLYTKEMAVDILREQLIIAYENIYGEYIPSDIPPVPNQTPDNEYLAYTIPRLYVQEETDRYYVIPVIWDFWVDKYTGEVFLYYNGIDPMLYPFDPLAEGALTFAG